MALYSPVRAKDKHDEYMLSKISKELNMTRIAAKLMLNRGISSVEDAYYYIYPNIDHLKNPFDLFDMDKAVHRIKLAIEKGQRITVYGDYDVDGVTASAILYLHLSDLGADVDVYIPHRYSEGYGLNIGAIERLHATGTDLLITVDCGITSFDEIDLAQKLGMDVIVTDHHNIDKVLPPAVAIINPKRPENPDEDELAGVGVVAKLIHAMGGKEALMSFLDLVAIGTVADIVPLVGDNRILVALGLKSINTSPRIGIRALAEVSGLDYRKIKSQNIAFGIAPRLNAAGRMGSALDAFNLLVSDDPKYASTMANKLDKANRNRQEQESKILKEAKECVEAHLTGQDRIIILDDRNWHAGIIGIAASKLVEIYRRPVILLTNVRDDLYTGSARSIDGFDIYRALCTTDHILEKFGGHEQAAGITIKEENISKLKESLDKYTRDKISREMLIPQYEYDIELYNEDITFELYNDLEKMEPFGLANPIPTFLLRDAYVDSFRLVGKRQNHIKLKIGLEGRLWEGIWFNSGDAQHNLDMKPCTKMLVNLSKNEWNGLTKLQFNLKSVKIQTETDKNFDRLIDIFYFKFFDDFYGKFLYNRNSDCKTCSDATEMEISGYVDVDEMFHIFKASSGGNIILVSDRQIAIKLLSAILDRDLRDRIEVGYVDLIQRNGRGIDGIVILPQIPTGRLNEYENIFIIEGDRFITPTKLAGVKNHIWIVDSDIECSPKKDFILTRKDFILVYRWFQQAVHRQRFWNDMLSMFDEFNKIAKDELNYFQFRLIVEIFKELDFLKCNITNGHVIAQLKFKPESRDLEESMLYRYYTSWLSELGM